MELEIVTCALMEKYKAKYKGVIRECNGKFVSFFESNELITWIVEVGWETFTWRTWFEVSEVEQSLAKSARFAELYLQGIVNWKELWKGWQGLSPDLC